MILFGGEDKPYSSFTRFGGISGFLFHRLILSRKLASDKPGAILYHTDSRVGADVLREFHA